MIDLVTQIARARDSAMRRGVKVPRCVAGPDTAREIRAAVRRMGGTTLWDHTGVDLIELADVEGWLVIDERRHI